MEVDRSYHPLDAELISRHYVPGFTASHDLAALAAARRPMERAYGYGHLFKLRASDKLSPAPTPPRLKDRMRALMGNARAKAHAKDGHPGFDTAIYLYGRPFLITQSDPGAIALLLERILREEREDEIVAAFRAELEHFDVDVAEEVAAFVKRRPPQPLPADKVKRLYGKIFHDRQVLLRDALLFLGRPGDVPPDIAQDAMEEDPDMEQRTRLNPVERFAQYAGYGLGLMLAEVRPFWCHRTALDLADVAAFIGAPDAAAGHGDLLAPLHRLVPEAAAHATPRIEGHFTAGSYVPADRVASFLDLLSGGRARLVAHARERGGEGNPELHAQMLIEAATYARHVGLGLIEVGDVRVAEEGGMP